MIKIEHIEIYGWESAIRGMRNPMNSWDKSDSALEVVGKSDTQKWEISATIGKNDLSLMKKLCKAGTDHRKFMRMITVTMDITAPLYWWKEYDTYKVGTVANSCSTMHRIHEKEFTLDDFSHERIESLPVDEKISHEFIYGLEVIVNSLNVARTKFLETKDKRYWWQMIQLLPSSYNQKRTVQLNYEVLANMYHSRRNHKLDEWVEFCHTIETLPYSELITAERK